MVCKWIVRPAARRGAPYEECGKPSVYPGSSWCAAHHARVVMAASPAVEKMREIVQASMTGTAGERMRRLDTATRQIVEAEARKRGWESTFARKRHDTARKG